MCDTARKTLATQSIQGVSVSNQSSPLWCQDADNSYRIHSLITLASTCHCAICFALTLYTRSSTECGENTSGSGSRGTTFWGVSSMNSTRGQYIPLCDDCMHTNEWLPNSFVAIPPISKLYHFSNGVCRLKYITAQEQGIILCVSRRHGWGPPSGLLNWRISISPCSHLEFVQKHETKTYSSFQQFNIWLASSYFPGSTPTPPQPYLFWGGILTSLEISQR